MTQISQSPFEWLIFDENGALQTPAAPSALAKSLAATGSRDLVIISHGWKTDQAGAQALYFPLWANVTKSLVAAGKLDPAKVVVGGVVWPSSPYEPGFDTPSVVPAGGGTLDLGGMAAQSDLDPAKLAKIVDQYCAWAPPAATAKIRAAVKANQNGFSDGSAQDLLEALKATIDPAGAAADPELQAQAQILSSDGLALLQKLVDPAQVLQAPPSAGALGLLDNVQATLSGPAAAIGRLLNQFTYFAMKTRAGLVGGKLGSETLPTITPPAPTRVHLIGHSFGGRLVTAAATAFAGSANLQLSSLTLLQGAFSQNALSPDFNGGGVYRQMLEDNRVSGPVTITHTHNDSACTLDYALASRVSNDTTKSIGDKNDPFGAMGANGAQNLPDGAWIEAQALAKEKASYTLDRSKVNNVLGDACISEHMDVTNADVGALVSSVLNT